MRIEVEIPSGIILLAELRAGILGRISYETPEIIEVEMAELEIIRQNKATKIAAKKQKYLNRASSK